MSDPIKHLYKLTDQMITDLAYKISQLKTIEMSLNSRSQEKMGHEEIDPTRNFTKKITDTISEQFNQNEFGSKELSIRKTIIQILSATVSRPELSKDLSQIKKLSSLLSSLRWYRSNSQIEKTLLAEQEEYLDFQKERPDIDESSRVVEKLSGINQGLHDFRAKNKSSAFELNELLGQFDSLIEDQNIVSPQAESKYSTSTENEPANNFVGEKENNDFKVVDTLILHLPVDATTDQSLVYLDFMSSNKKRAQIKLSHMEAAFLYYLGSERKAGESYWLHAPNEHRELLLKIWNSFSLPPTFEVELEFDSPKKDSTTWIWDFRNTNRKTLRNQIQRKIKYLQSEALDFNLITSIKSKSPSRGGNYKLNSMIENFNIITPAK